MESKHLDQEQTELLLILKEITINELKDIQIDKVLFNNTRDALMKSRCQSYKAMIKAIVANSINFESVLRNSNRPLIITYDYHRRDHTEYWSRFKAIVGSYDEIRVDVGEKHAVSPREFIRAITRYHSVNKQLKRIKDKKSRRVLAAALVDLLKVNDYIEKLKLNNAAAFIFFDGNYVENLIVQKLRNKGITVATMQHGQPVFHGLDCDRINQTMILNFSSDYIMVTGEFSKKQFMLGGVPEKKIFVGGSLRKVNQVKASKEKDFVVFLDCPTNPNAVRDNKELMECAKKISNILDSRYVIKCHPQDDPQNYSNFSDCRGVFAAKGTCIQEILEAKRFGILHASGVYLDIISEGIKAFCYVNDTDFPLVEEGMDSFVTVNELFEKIKIWDSYKTDEKREYMCNLMEYYLSPFDVENRYKEFVNKLNSSNRVDN